MPTLVNNLRAIRGPVTAVPVVGQSGVVVEPDTQNNQVVVRADETVLFDEASSHGQSGNVTLSESRDNFDYVRIIYRQNDGHNECKDVYNIDSNTNLTLNSFTLFNGFPINKISKYTISGNTITFIEGGEYTSSGWTSGSRINILKVIGINRIANN